MTYAIKFKASVTKDLRCLGRQEGQRVLTHIYENLAKNPRLGIPLKGDKNKLWRYRVGDYRVVYSFSDSELWILVVHIAHRKDVYRD